ncbi:PDR/VanB family oxidoreductase [Marinomonas pollencensis]|uniref:Vanillate O-demethylase ferredoxin subunit n=1 Tax=Marinomonas pollencensis TaxID=491954 RepID=A0A3E0DVE0_9GAMM|nr:PDR/VanB family oxidoreductase [Marinomonas pollencensis]REG86868.1 vanillate O-demethylase ferredoxin subunit [Marinomonas pollencensis]
MISVIVAERHIEAEGIVRLVFQAEEVSRLPEYEAGAHIDVHLPSGRIRPYSLCWLQEAAASYQVAVLKTPSSEGGSEEMHRLSVGEKLTISEPKNHFSLSDAGSKFVLVAGGIGIVPLLAMAQQLDKTARPFELHYCARSSQNAAFVDWLTDSPFADKVQFHFSQESGSGRLDCVHLLSQQALNTRLYVCGPAGLIQQLESQALSFGWSQDYVHKEYFSAPEDAHEALENTVFSIKIHSTGEVLEVAPEQTITEVLEAHGVFIPVSCEEGVCGTCQTAVVHGVPEHRDTFLSERERASGKLIMPCCSRAKTSMLELDI